MKKLLSIVLALCLLFTAGCTTKKAEPVSRSAALLDTVITVQIYDESKASLLDECIDLCSDYEKQLSRTMEGSEIWNLNHSNGNPVTLSDDTVYLLKKGIEYSEFSNGLFDITIGSVSDLWDFKNASPSLPSEENIREALSYVNYDLIEISGNTVRLLDPHTIVDLGGLAKGFIADKLKEFLMDKGIKNGIINLGGNILTIGTKPDGSDYNIGIQKPFDQQGAALTSVQTHDTSVVTSGIYQRYFQVDDKIYHHLIDPSTGYPCDNNLYSVSILTSSSLDADALSTICFLSGLEEGLKIIDSLEDTEAIFVTSDNALHYSKGLAK